VSYLLDCGDTSRGTPHHETHVAQLIILHRGFLKTVKEVKFGEDGCDKSDDPSF
jgi:hypothetical protein